MPPHCPSDAPILESVGFPSGPHRLEGELAYGEADAPGGAVLIASPHPLLGGHMGNNVVRCLGDGLARRGYVTLRFNYRGVGGSEGPPVDTAAHLARFWETSRVPDEAHHRDDLAAALDFLRGAAGDGLPLAIAGYSYGCSLLPHAVARSPDRATGPDRRSPEASGAGEASSETCGRPGWHGQETVPQRAGYSVLATRYSVLSPLVLIAPTVGTHDYGGFDGLTNPKLVVAPQGDFAADTGRLLDWFDGLREPKRLERPRLDSHFFRGFEDWLAATVAGFLDDQWG
jgi:alpha/beta superfamily hydrolase